MESSDADLLAAWLERRDERAFHHLVRRYAGLVHVAARRTCGDEQLAAEVSQNVFVLLARNAALLVPRGSVAGWLHLTAVMQARNVARGARREARKRERFRALQDKLPAGREERRWSEMRPEVDGALASLGMLDREVLLLHFYRSMEVAEVAATLGIAPEAARKRIVRATSRLRERLMLRGIETGGSPLATLVIGTAGEFQVSSATVTVLAGKAAAVAPAKFAFSSSMPVLASIIAMKGFVLIPPAAALLLAGAVLAYQQDELLHVERKSESLRRRIEAMDSLAAAATRTPGRDAAPGTTVSGKWTAADWKAAAEALSGIINGKVGMVEMKEIQRMQKYLEAVTPEEIVEVLDEIGGMELRAETRRLMEKLLADPLIRKAPAVALERFVDRIHDEGGTFAYMLSPALGAWMRQDPEAATAWFDARIAEGKFDDRSFSGKAFARVRFEAQWIGARMGGDPAACVRRLGELPEEQRIAALREVADIHPREEDHISYATVARQVLPPESRTATVVNPVTPLVGKGGYAAASAYLAKISATPEERTSGVERAAMARFSIQSGANRKIGTADLGEYRKWAVGEIPGNEEAVLGTALWKVGSTSRAEYVKTIDLLTADHAARGGAGGDDVLIHFLERKHADPATHQQARTLAAKIADPAKRETIFKNLEP